MLIRGWEGNSVTVHMLSMDGALDSVPSTERKEKERKVNRS